MYKRNIPYVVSIILFANISFADEISLVEEMVDLPIEHCPLDMIYVHGQMISGDSEYIEALQNNTCTDWINVNFPERCRAFSQTSWIKISSKLPRKFMEFCIDNYEYPNIYMEKPVVNINWIDASEICESLNKRLCSEDEWTFACEGEEGLPYPYGYVRDPTICNIDKPWIEVNYTKLFSKSPEQELNRLWQGELSGKMPGCVSSFGVHDMTGNVDEMTFSVRASGNYSILKGGYWSVVRNRCRPTTRIHNEWHHNYQQGFRCCSDI